jgi:ribonuclease P protein component
MAAPDLSFPPAMRLHDARDYSRVFNRQQKAAGRHAVVLVRRQEAPGGVVPRARLGVMVPAKAVPSAVRRHLVKRWVRELFRTRLAAGMPGMEMVVLLRADPPADGHAAFAAEVTEQLRRALAAQAQPGQGRGRGGRRPERGGKGPGPGGAAKEAPSQGAPGPGAPGGRRQQGRGRGDTRRDRTDNPGTPPADGTRP